MIEEMLTYNKKFVSEGGYKPYLAGNHPRKKLAVLACMDTRLVELLPAALGIKNGDVKLIKNAGGMILDPLDTSVRSLLIAVLELGVEKILVLGHTDCGVSSITPETVLTHLRERGITQASIDRMAQQGIDFTQWFSGFGEPEKAVKKSVSILREHPLMPKDVTISGGVMDVTTGEVKMVER